VNDLEDEYFEYLLKEINPEGLREEQVYVCSLLHNCIFQRRVGLDINRADDGRVRRNHFLYEEKIDLSPEEQDEFFEYECTWLEMLVALSDRFSYSYGGSPYGRFLEVTSNMGLDPLYQPVGYRSKRMEEFDQGLVRVATSRVDNNHFDRRGRGGLFPLSHAYRDQREVELWLQMNDYIMDREGENLGLLRTTD
jgi:hypothetical protein